MYWGEVAFNTMMSLYLGTFIQTSLCPVMTFYACLHAGAAPRVTLHPVSCHPYVSGSPPFIPPFPFLYAHCYQNEESFFVCLYVTRLSSYFPVIFPLHPFHNIISPMMFTTPPLWVTCLFLCFLSKVPVQTSPLGSVAVFQAPPGPLGPTLPSLYFYIFACPPLSCMAFGTLLNREPTKTPRGSACAQ